ncbi:disease resistance protein RPP4-like [Gossypium hirsutum]|uniref:Disease resistance protein RPP4-like n=1 Tax=Gossypium hirsutum TaxID=3635 RepID=A0ABM3AT04_GOSHI|nr:disease resistance protein RPP4-like [Gossypium hirsutum]
MSGIRNLVDKCLLDSIDCYSMHDMLEEIGKDIVRQECKEDPGKRSRLWFPEDVDQVLRYNKIENGYRNPKFLVDQVDSISLPNKLRYLCWDYFPLKTLSSFNPKNLVMLILRSGNMEQLWNENDHMNLVNLREIDVSNCKKLRKIPNLSRALNLELLDCSYCESLFELPCLNHLASRDEDKLRLEGCYSLKKFPQVPSHFCYLDLRETEIQEVPDAIKYLHKLERLLLSKSKRVSNCRFAHTKLEA